MLLPFPFIGLFCVDVSVDELVHATGSRDPLWVWSIEWVLLSVNVILLEFPVYFWEFTKSKTEIGS